MDDYVSKPIVASILRDVIDKWLLADLDSSQGGFVAGS